MVLENSRRITPQTTSLFICDVQERFKGVIWEYSSVISIAQKMIKASKILDIPVIVSEQYVKAFGKTVSELDISEAAVCVEKTKFSMFLPEVTDCLIKRNTKSIILLGIESHVCVLQTALEFIEKGYIVYVLSDGISSQNFPEIDIAVARMKAAGAIITTSESILFELLHDAKHDKFKSISALVKEYMGFSKTNKLLYKSSSL